MTSRNDPGICLDPGIFKGIFIFELTKMYWRCCVLDDYAISECACLMYGWLGIHMD